MKRSPVREGRRCVAYRTRGDMQPWHKSVLCVTATYTGGKWEVQLHMRAGVWSRQQRAACGGGGVWGGWRPLGVRRGECHGGWAPQVQNEAEQRPPRPSTKDCRIAIAADVTPITEAAASGQKPEQFVPVGQFARLSAVARNRPSINVEAPNPEGPDSTDMYAAQTGWRNLSAPVLGAVHSYMQLRSG
jgi:hypothetical protein